LEEDSRPLEEEEKLDISPDAVSRLITSTIRWDGRIWNSTKASILP